MPTGVYYDIQFRMNIFKNCIHFGHDALWIMEHCYHLEVNENRNISLKYLKSLCSNLEDPEFAQNYLLGPKVHNKSGYYLK